MNTGRTRKTPKKATAKKAQKNGVVVKVNVPQAEVIANDLAIEKTVEFGAFLKWISLPSMLRGKPVTELKLVGIHDEETQALLSIETQQEFARRYKVRDATLTHWKQKLGSHGVLLEAKAFFKAQLPNVYASFLKKTIEHADAPRVRLMEEMFNGMAPEGGGSTQPQQPTIVQQTHIQTVIIGLGREYDEKLKKEYESIIREEVQGTQRVRPDPTAQG